MRKITEEENKKRLRPDINTWAGYTLFLRNSRNGTEKFGIVISTDYKEGSVDVDTGEEIVTLDTEFLWEYGCRTEDEREISGIMHNAVGSNCKKGIDYPNDDGSYDKGVDSPGDIRFLKKSKKSDRN